MSEKQNCKSVVRCKQKVVVKFLTCEGEKQEIHECVKMVYGENVFDVSTINSLGT